MAMLDTSGQGIDDEIIGAIYGAVKDPERWHDVLARLQVAFDAQAASLARHDLARGAGRYLSFVGLDPRYATRVEDFAPLNPWMRNRSLYQPEGVVSGEDVLSNGELVRQEFYLKYLRPMHCLHRLCGVVHRSGDRICVVSLLRRPDQSAFSQLDRASMARLLPHFRQSLELQWELAHWRSERDVLLEVIQELPLAVAVVDAEARLLATNRAANAVLALEDGLGRRNGCLHAMGHVDAERLLRQVAAACAGDRRPAQGAFEPVTITRPSGRHPLLVIVCPITRLVEGHLGDQEGVCALLIKDPDAELATSPVGLRQLTGLYRLTPAEERLVGLLLDGLGLFEAASRLEISRNTARSHMKHIYAKTGTNRQTDLVHRLGRASIDPRRHHP